MFMQDKDFMLDEVPVQLHGMATFRLLSAVQQLGVGLQKGTCGCHMHACPDLCYLLASIQA